MSRVSWPLLAAGGITVSFSLGCVGGLRITMTNESEYPVHVWVDDFEDMSSHNKLKPGHSRHYVDKEGAAVTVYTVMAGRDGQVIATTVCSQDSLDVADYKVLYSEYSGPSLWCGIDE